MKTIICQTSNSVGPRLRLVSLALLLATFTSAAHAQFANTIANGQVTITKYFGPGGEAVVPGRINGLPVTSIGNRAFAGSGVTTVTIPENVTSIGGGAFDQCTSLTNVMIPQSVTSIENFAFRGCERLTSVTIPNSVARIGGWAFIGCASLTSVMIPSRVTNIAQGAFALCTSLTSITVSAQNSAYSSADGVLFNKDQNTLVQYPAGKTVGSYTIPNGVTSIGNRAFMGSGLTSVTIPDSVTGIEDDAFHHCPNLTSVTIPSSVIRIRTHAFVDCTNLTSAVFEGNAPMMGKGVFAGTASGFKVTYYSNGATASTSPTWTDSSGDTYPAVVISRSVVPAHQVAVNIAAPTPVKTKPSAVPASAPLDFTTTTTNGRVNNTKYTGSGGAVDPATRVARWQEDLDDFARDLPSGQTDCFLLMSQDRFEREVTELKRQVPQLSDPEILFELMRIVASFGLAHTGVDFWSAPDTMALHHYPLQMQWFSDGLAVMAAAPEYQEALGCRVVRIGSYTPEQAEAALAPYIPHENDAWLHFQSPGYMTLVELIQHEKIAASSGCLRLICAKAGGEEFTLEIAPGKGQKLMKAAETLHVPTALCRSNPDAFYWYKYLSETHTLYIQYSKCRNEPDNPFVNFTRDLFAFADTQSVQRVIVDLRFNMGGNSDILQPLVAGLKSRPDLVAKGHLYTLVGSQTFSSGMFAAVDFRDRLHAILVGEPTGNKPNHYGDLRYFLLPNSNLRVNYSTKHFHLIKYADPSTLEPDIFTPQSLNDFLAGRDPVLEAALPTGQASAVDIPTAEQAAEMEIQRKGSLAGIGAEIDKTKDQIVIKTVLPGSPAEKAGLKAGEVITVINSIPTTMMTREDAVKLIRGPKGTQIELTVTDPSSATTRQVAIIRAIVTLGAATGRVLDGNVGLLTIPYFSEATPKQMKSILESFATLGVKGVVLDLRGNGGGNSLKEVAGLFVGKEPVLWLVRKTSDKLAQPSHALGNAMCQSPLVVLVDRLTAAGAEIIASALQTSKRATVVGQKTFGNAVNQSMEAQPDGSTKLVVVAYYLTADGNPIDGAGIKPDVPLDANLSKEEALRKAVEVLLGQKPIKEPQQAARSLEVTLQATPTPESISQPKATPSLTVDEWKKKAVERYPDLAVAGSPLNLAFAAKYKAYQGTSYFDSPDWPMRLAKECDEAVRAPSSPSSLPEALQRGLILYYNFNTPPDSGTIPDKSGHGNNGNAVGVEWVAEGHGGAMKFGLTKSYITVPNNETLNPPVLTLAAWIKTSYTDSVWRRIFDKRAHEGYILSMCGDYKGKSFRGQMDIEPGKTYAMSGVNVADGQWHQVVGTFDGYVARVYVDGQPVGGIGHWKGKSPSTSCDLTIGANRSNPDPALGEVDASFNGLMNDLMMFNRALTADEVQGLFKSQDGMVVSP